MRNLTPVFVNDAFLLRKMKQASGRQVKEKLSFKLAIYRLTPLLAIRIHIQSCGFMQARYFFRISSSRRKAK
jgi:hypothetical protein